MLKLNSDLIEKIQDIQGLTGNNLLFSSCQHFSHNSSIQNTVWKKSFTIHAALVRGLGITPGKKMGKLDCHLTHVLSETVVVVVDVLTRISKGHQEPITVHVPQCQRKFIPMHLQFHRKRNFPNDHNIQSNRLPGHVLRYMVENVSREKVFGTVHSPDRENYICCIEVFIHQHNVVCSIRVKNDYSINVTTRHKELQVDHRVWTPENHYIQFVTQNALWLLQFPDVIRDILWASAKCSDDMSYWISRGDLTSEVVSSLYMSSPLCFRNNSVGLRTYKANVGEETILSIFLQLIAGMVSGHDIGERCVANVSCLNILAPYQVEPVQIVWKPMISHWYGEITCSVSSKEVRFFTSDCIINQKNHLMKGVFRYWMRM